MTIAIRITPTLFIASGGKFRHDRRYLRAGASGSRFPIVQGASLEIATVPDPRAAPSTGLVIPAIRWSVGGVVRQQTLTYSGASGNLPVNSGGFNAAATLVKT